MAEETSDLGKLVYAEYGNSLAHNGESGHLVYKGDAAPKGWTRISFAWDKTANDLDICAYWSDAKETKVGYSHGGSGLHESGPYKIEYSGDVRGANNSEWVKVIMSPWREGLREFVVHLNYYGYDEEDYPGDTCTIVASQEGGRTIVKRDVVCSANRGRPADEESGFATIRFDKTGRLIGIE